MSEAPPRNKFPVNNQGKSSLRSWEVLKSREVFAAQPWIRVFEQEVQLPSGAVIDDYYRIELGEFALVFAQTLDGSVIVERQYKHGTGRVGLVLPAGSIEAGEDPLSAAQRELLEETGCKSDHWQPLGDFVVNGNYGCGKAHLFMARDAYRVAEPDSGDLEEIEIVLMEPDKLMNALLDGQVHLLSSATLIALAQIRLSNG